jgi:hypothetical protein
MAKTISRICARGVSSERRWSTGITKPLTFAGSWPLANCATSICSLGLSLYSPEIARKHRHLFRSGRANSSEARAKPLQVNHAGVSGIAGRPLWEIVARVEGYNCQRSSTRIRGLRVQLPHDPVPVRGMGSLREPPRSSTGYPDEGCRSDLPAIVGASALSIAAVPARCASPLKNPSLFCQQAVNKRPPDAEYSCSFVISGPEHLAAAMVLGNVARLRVTAIGTGFDQE